MNETTPIIHRHHRDPALRSSSTPAPYARSREAFNRGEPIAKDSVAPLAVPTGPEWRWALLCAGLCFPVTAILHHAVFYPPTCMLNPFGLEYEGEALRAWLRHDPSLRYGLAAGALVFVLGRRGPWANVVRRVTAAFVVAFAPLALWIWDIPLLDRPICKWGHDSRIVLPLLGRLRSLWFYMGGTGVFAGLLLWSWVKNGRRVPHLISGEEPATEELVTAE